jgi:uncharacterized protein YndB with AHSA1/START domain
VSVTITVCTSIDAPVQVVWAAIERIESHTEWMQDAVRITFASEQHRGVGARFECLTRVGPLHTNDRFVVTRWEPDVSMAIAHRGAVTGDADFRLAPERTGRTRFCWEERLQFPWWLGGVVGERIGAPVLRHLWRGNLARLKAMVERTQRQAPGSS